MQVISHHPVDSVTRLGSFYLNQHKSETFVPSP